MSNLRCRKIFLLVLLAVYFLGYGQAFGGWASNPVTVTSGQLNPEFSGVKFNRIMVSAINIPPDFRKELESVTAIRIGRFKKDKWRGVYEDIAVEFRKLFPEPTFQPEKRYETKALVERIGSENIDLFVLINILNDGGENIENADSYSTALQLSGNHTHNVLPVTAYRFAKITLFDTRSGKIVWKGDGIVKAKPGTANWYNQSAKSLAISLIKHLEKSGVLTKE